jgi:MFS family permease
MTESETPLARDPYAAFRFRDFRLLIGGRFIAQLGEAMVSIAIGYELYLRTRDPLLLGLVGLVQVLPVIALSLLGGYVADRFNRRLVTGLSQALLVLCSVGLTWVSLTEGPLWVLYAILTVIGVARAFNNPAESALTPQTVEPEYYGNATTWNSVMWQSSAIIGPAVGGFLIAAFGTALAVYIFNIIAGLVLITVLFLLRSEQRDFGDPDAHPWEAVKDGLRFLRSAKILLAAITLDMFAVLLGGAIALMPIYATDILHVGADGLGILRAAPSVGALLMALLLARLPPIRKAGWTLLWAVAGFGLATIIFGISTNFWLSLLMLALTGALDNISVVIRGTLFLTETPDALRGRVGAVNYLFIGISNEMGSFESGVAAALLGPVGAVVFGGVGTMVVVALVAWRSPQLRALNQMRGQGYE